MTNHICGDPSSPCDCDCMNRASEVELRAESVAHNIIELSRTDAIVNRILKIYLQGLIPSEKEMLSVMVTELAASRRYLLERLTDVATHDYIPIRPFKEK